MSKSKTKVEKTTPKAVEKKSVKKAPDKAKVVNPAKGTPRAKKPIAKPASKSPAVQKAAEAALPAKVDPSCSSETTNEITVNTADTVNSDFTVEATVTVETKPSIREFDKEAKVTEEKPVIESMYLAHCLFRRDNIIISEVIGAYTSPALATEAIQARETFHTEQGHMVMHSVMYPILVDDVKKEKITAVVYEDALALEEEAIAEERIKSDEEIVTAKEMEKHVESLAKEEISESSISEEDVKKWLIDHNFRPTLLNRQPIEVFVVTGSHFAANGDFISSIYAVSRNRDDANIILENKKKELEGKVADRIRLDVHAAIVNPYASQDELYNNTIEVSRLGTEWFSFGVWIENLFKKLFKKN